MNLTCLVFMMPVNILFSAGDFVWKKMVYQKGVYWVRLHVVSEVDPNRFTSICVAEPRGAKIHIIY